MLRGNPLVFGNRPALILCIDDNPIYLRAPKALLEQEGYHVIGVTTADEAMRALHDNPICLTISDLLLRETTATLLAAQMKKLKPRVPIVVYSDDTPASLRNVDAFISKKEPTTKLLSLILDILERYLG